MVFLTQIDKRLLGNFPGLIHVDLMDILCVLDGFAGDFTNCSLESVDLAPCKPDGIVDLGDILAALNAFEGNNPCVAARSRRTG